MNHSSGSKIRIIGGQWRGRWIEFPNLPLVRPTPNRIRETLFNWLGQTLTEKRCLDMFAGSGALGFEALSRGAEEVVMVENHPLCFKFLKKNAHRLGCQSSLLLKQQNTLTFLEYPIGTFDVIFLDPPYHSDLLKQSMELLTPWLHEETILYCETCFPISFPQYTVLKNSKAGQIYFYLVKLNNNLTL